MEKDREGAAYEQLAGLDLLGREDVEAMLVSAISDTKEELLDAIDEVAAISKGTAETLRRLVAETFDRPYLDLDAVALLADSAASLRHLPGSADQLSAAAGSLKHLPASVDVLSSTAPLLRGLGQNASTLSSAAEGLTNLDKRTGEIRSAASELRSALHHAGSGASQQLSGVVARMETALKAADRAEYGPSVIQQVDYSRNWLFFKSGLVVGAALVLAIVIFILIYLHK